MYLIVNMDRNQGNVPALVTAHDHNVLIAVLPGFEDSKINGCVLFQVLRCENN